MGKTVNKELDALKERHSDITIIDWYSVANNNQNYLSQIKFTWTQRVGNGIINWEEFVSVEIKYNNKC